MANSNLTNTKRDKNDEFSTQYLYVEKEMNEYLEYNPDVFSGKTVLLPCDDPEWSNFTKLFALVAIFGDIFVIAICGIWSASDEASFF